MPSFLSIPSILFSLSFSIPTCPAHSLPPPLSSPSQCHSLYLRRPADTLVRSITTLSITTLSFPARRTPHTQKKEKDKKTNPRPAMIKTFFKLELPSDARAAPAARVPDEDKWLFLRPVFACLLRVRGVRVPSFFFLSNPPAPAPPFHPSSSFLSPKDTRRRTYPGSDDRQLDVRVGAFVAPVSLHHKSRQLSIQ